MKKTSKIWICSLMIMSFLLVLTYGCKKDEEPEPTPEPTPAATTVTDIDGNVYHTVKIGTQTWMVENLKVTHYRNGDPIIHCTDMSQWSNLATGMWINYDNMGTNGEIYGHLYNWSALVNGPLIAPSGWHIPTEAEWQTLVDFLGGENLAGGKLKEAGTSHWQAPNTGATNESGFTALPGGDCTSGTFSQINTQGTYWSSTETSLNVASTFVLFNNDSAAIISAAGKAWGFSVRCIKD
jgi:uncharacterized protein (TIGR02145 family)